MKQTSPLAVEGLMQCNALKCCVFASKLHIGQRLLHPQRTAISKWTFLSPCWLSWNSLLRFLDRHREAPRICFQCIAAARHLAFRLAAFVLVAVPWASLPFYHFVEVEGSLLYVFELLPFSQSAEIHSPEFLDSLADVHILNAQWLSPKS